MTIRDYIKRRVRLTWVLFIVLLLTTLIGAAVISALFNKLDLNLTVSIVLPLAVAFTFWRLMHIKCPRCLKNVGLGAAMEQTDHCPHCDASFDQPVSPADGASPNTAAKPLTIRKYVHQRATQVQIFLMLAIVLVGIAVITRYSVTTWAAILLGLIATAVGMLVAVAVAASTPCPRCLKQLGRAGASLMSKKPANNCPACGISFDEPIPRKME
jgi:hypothetical protein